MSGNVPFRATHVDDLRRHQHHRPSLRLDEGSLQMTNDPTCSIYRRLSETLQKQVRPRQSISEVEEGEKLEYLKKYGADLVEFMKDKDGRLKEKFDKVFIT